MPFCLLKSIVSGLFKSFHLLLYLFNSILGHVQQLLTAVVRVLGRWLVLNCLNAVAVVKLLVAGLPNLLQFTQAKFPEKNFGHF
jgi:hypothetical protein